jgi:hypothetical protein
MTTKADKTTKDSDESTSATELAETSKDGVSEPKKLQLKKALKSKYIFAIVILLIAVLPAFYFYNRSKQAEQRLNDPNTANQKVIDEVVKKVGRHILLPTGEQPTLATVSDVSKVKSQPFFVNSNNGDKVLVYTQARKAILYRPSKDIIIEVAPLNIDSSQLKATSQ